MQLQDGTGQRLDIAALPGIPNLARELGAALGGEAVVQRFRVPRVLPEGTRLRIGLSRTEAGPAPAIPLRDELGGLFLIIGLRRTVEPSRVALPVPAPSIQ